MDDDPDYIVDISSVNDGEPIGPIADDRGDSGRRWLGVQFECCGVYARIYRNRQGAAYVGHCPRCSRPLRIRIRADGTACRFFRAH